MQHARERYPVSERHAYRVSGQSRTTQCYQLIVADDQGLPTAAEGSTETAEARKAVAERRILHPPPSVVALTCLGL